jgi:hypothetical protein
MQHNQVPSTDGFNMNNEKLLDRQDILQMFPISVRTLQYWRTKGILPHSKIGNKIFYRQKDVEEMVMKNKVVKK